MTSLRGKTLLITGASRGIGKAIALRAAREGANVAVVAKTDAPHPRLPGTVHTAVDEINAAGGRGLACVTDVRLEEQVQAAVQRTVDAFGGIDILVNNASAIQLTGTIETEMKRFDLMQAVNVRGTFVCSRACVPWLKRSSNPHILTISPPLNLDPRWFKDHVAYTISKYGMSLCVLGMAAEFADAGIAVNALWPRTIIATAAVQNLLGGDVAMAMSRKPEIMADAAHVVLTGDSRAMTGQFLIDEQVLAQAGVTNFDDYSYVPGADLRGDIFLD